MKLGGGGRFAKLSNSVAKSYEKKGMPKAKAEVIAKKTAAAIGRSKYGAKKMASMAAKGKAKKGK